jgi:hypothetical protein
MPLQVGYFRNCFIQNKNMNLGFVQLYTELIASKREEMVFY